MRSRSLQSENLNARHIGRCNQKGSGMFTPLSSAAPPPSGLTARFAEMPWRQVLEVGESRIVTILDAGPDEAALETTDPKDLSGPVRAQLFRIGKATFTPAPHGRNVWTEAGLRSRPYIVFSVLHGERRELVLLPAHTGKEIVDQLSDRPRGLRFRVTRTKASAAAVGDRWELDDRAASPEQLPAPLSFDCLRPFSEEEAAEYCLRYGAELASFSENRRERRFANFSHHNIF